jgi:hypothetical protein
MASQECVSNVEMACKELTEAVATNASREPQRNLFQRVVCKADKMCQLPHLEYKNPQKLEHKKDSDYFSHRDTEIAVRRPSYGRMSAKSLTLLCGIIAGTCQCLLFVYTT